MAAVGLAVLAGAGGAVAATQSGSPSASAQEQAYISDLAAKLGVTPSALTAAIKATDNDQINAAVAAGRLTTAQADALKASIQASTSPLPGLHFGMGSHGFGSGRLGVTSAAVQYLGISEATLRADLSAGQSLDAIANATAGKSAAGLKAAIIAAETTGLNTAVTNGDITSQQEQQRLSDLSSRLDTLLAQTWSGTGAGGGGWAGRGWGRGGGYARDGATGLFGGGAPA
ncbi:MAG TPA: hypothetical protein VN740_03105 [Solirubrobacteraceae bacterium]|nr:hypothetical protein [Solirubrobacteraceae bacterium]